MEKEIKREFDDLDDSEIDFSDAPELTDEELECLVPQRKILEMILTSENIAFCEDNFSFAMNGINRSIYYYGDEKAMALFEKPLDEIELEMQQQFANITEDSELKPNCPLRNYLYGTVSRSNIELCKKYAGENYIFGMNRIIYAYRKEWQQKQELNKAA